MMPISLPPTPNSAQADALAPKSASVDLETSQPASFGELLKVEEMKLQAPSLPPVGMTARPPVEMGFVDDPSALPPAAVPPDVFSPQAETPADDGPGGLPEANGPARHSQPADGTAAVEAFPMYESGVEEDEDPFGEETPETELTVTEPTESLDTSDSTPPSAGADAQPIVDGGLDMSPDLLPRDAMPMYSPHNPPPRKTEAREPAARTHSSSTVPIGRSAAGQTASAAWRTQSTHAAAGQQGFLRAGGPAEAGQPAAPLTSGGEAASMRARSDQPASLWNGEDGGSARNDPVAEMQLGGAQVEGAEPQPSVRTRTEGAASLGDEMPLRPQAEPPAWELELETDGLEPSTLPDGSKRPALEAPEKSSAPQARLLDVDLVQQVARQMKSHLKSGETSMRLRLDPLELGSIEVQMVSNPLGVSVSFVAEQAGTGQLLESQIDQLRQSLKEAGVQLTHLDVNQHRQPGQQEGGFFKQEPQSFAQTARRDVPRVGMPDAPARPRRLSGSHEVDYLI